MSYDENDFSGLEEYIEGYKEDLEPEVDGSQQYENAEEFAKSVRADAGFYGVNDQVEMTYNTVSDELTIEQAVVDMDDVDRGR